MNPAWTAANGLLASSAAALGPDPCGFEFTATPNQGPSTLTQTHLRTIAGDNYTLSFSIEDAASGAGGIEIFFDGTLIDNFIPSGILAGRGYVTDFYETGGISAFGEDHGLVAQPGPNGSVLSFAATAQSGAWYLNNISLTGPAASPTPEPSGWAPTAIGIVALALLVYRRRAKAANAGETALLLPERR